MIMAIGLASSYSSCEKNNQYFESSSDADNAQNDKPVLNADSTKSDTVKMNITIYIDTTFFEGPVNHWN